MENILSTYANVYMNLFKFIFFSTAICFLMAAVTILTSLVYVSQRLMITSK